jgi:hypothetical protein
VVGIEWKGRLARIFICSPASGSVQYSSHLSVPLLVLCVAIIAACDDDADARKDDCSALYDLFHPLSIYQHEAVLGVGHRQSSTTSGPLITAGKG